MLVLSRKRNESTHAVVVDPKTGKLTVLKQVVVEIRGDKVRLGNEAPKTIPVHRGDVFQQIVERKLMRLILGKTSDNDPEVEKALRDDETYAEQWGRIDRMIRNPDYNSDMWQTVLKEMAQQSAGQS